MTPEQIAEAVAFIVHPALRAHAAARLTSGANYICGGCGQIADSQNGCAPCDTARFEAMAAEYDAQEADRDAFLYDLPAFAMTATQTEAQNEAAFDKMIEQRNFWGSPFDC